MIISHNIAAINSNRQYGIVTRSKSKSAEKLSSGYKINRAADNAAGLAISEKMRRQIRGLHQGSENIQDGISLVQVADGALHEISDMLQRVNELSIQAYNDTNTQQDRQYIQQEVSALVTEVGRVIESTTFNEMKVLKGEPVEYVPAHSNPDGFTLISSECVVPDWLKNSVDSKMELHGYTGQQDTSGIMLQAKDVSVGQDGEITVTDGEYYGPDLGLYKGIYTHAGTWTDTLTDNVTAKIDFSGLTSTTDAKKLYDNLEALIGCAIGVPCGTCNAEYMGIGFSGETDTIIGQPQQFSVNNSGVNSVISLTGMKNYTSDSGNAVNCFDKVMEMIQKHETDTTLTEQNKKDEVKALAQEIAKNLCKASYQALSGQTDHFDRVLYDASKPTELIIYDYRDNDKLRNPDSSGGALVSGASVEFTAKSAVKVSNKSLPPDTMVEKPSSLFIQCSAEVKDIIPLRLPALSLEGLGIRDYDIARYGDVQTTRYSDEYARKLSEWEKDVEVKEVVHPAEVRTKKVLVQDSVSYQNGERVVTYKEVEQQYTIPEYTTRELVHRNPKPTPQSGDIITEQAYGYDPDDVVLVKEALNQVMKCRAELGAQQNRLEHTYNNNLNKHENLTAAESRIRDTDMALEMVKYSKENVLTQVGETMLAQANQSRQGVLSLLQ